ncbi:MAG TPA: universal stress protein [Candidatus Acidoferrum sp.]|nr:universal stress protein [Candidatus Acidoferrum sp.]
MTKKIIVGVDFSPEADLAARQAIEIARHTGGEVVLVHAGDTVELPALGDGASASAREAFEVYRSRLALALATHREQLSALRERLSGQGPIVSQVLNEGFPDAALCEVAEKMHAGLVVVGTHGRTGLRWFFLGSVAAQVIRMCPTDVLVARREGTGRGGFRRILVATDFSPTAERALDRALDLAAVGAEVDVVHHYGVRWPALVYTGAPLAAMPSPPDLIAQEIVATARARGEELLAPRRRREVSLAFHARGGTPVPGLVHRLEEHAYDLVAVGSHGRRGFRLFAVGSVAEAVVRRAPCSVLVARGGAGG